MTPGDLPLDLTAVAADDAAIELLRARLAVDEPPPPAVRADELAEEPDDVLRLLGLLLDDVAQDLPADMGLDLAALFSGVVHGPERGGTRGPQRPARRTATVLPLRGVGGRARPARRTTAVLGLAAAVLSVGGAAAASPGRQVAGMRHALARAVGLASVTPGSDVAPRPGDATSRTLDAAGAGRPAAPVSAPTSALVSAPTRRPAPEPASRPALGATSRHAPRPSGAPERGARAKQATAVRRARAAAVSNAGGKHAQRRPTARPSPHGKTQTTAPIPVPRATGGSHRPPRGAPTGAPPSHGSPPKGGSGHAQAQPSSDASAKPRA